MNYYEVLVAGSRYQASEPLTYHYESELEPRTVVSVPLRGQVTSAFVYKKVKKPDFNTLPIKSVLSESVLPKQIIDMAYWLSEYYASTLGDALKQFAPSRTIRRLSSKPAKYINKKSDAKLILKPSAEQTSAIKKIVSGANGTYLLHGRTGSGKTYVYGELVKNSFKKNKSSIILVPEIALTTQIANYMSALFKTQVLVFHSHLSSAERKKLWFKILESSQPLLIIGPRSALFTPLKDIGLIVVDEAHELAYKQEQSPRYSAVRVASKLAGLHKAKTILGSATPAAVDYFAAEQKKRIITMNDLASSKDQPVETVVVDMKDKTQLSTYPFISKPMQKAIKQTVGRQQQALIYLNRRGSARMIMCVECGWQLLCPNCDTPAVYHSDKHRAICHSCGYHSSPPTNCANCKATDIIYKSAGTKAVAEALSSLFPQHKIARFDGDNKPGERFEERFQEVSQGKIDIIIGTQIISRGLDLPKLGMVGLIAAETSLSLPDYTADERTFQTIYQLMGRVGRGHSPTKAVVVVQTYNPNASIIKSAVQADWPNYYKNVLAERQVYRFPPFSFVLKLFCKRKTVAGAEKAAKTYYQQLINESPAGVQIIGPMPAFYYKRANNYYWQIILKSKSRLALQKIATGAPNGWSADLDPTHLL